MSGQWEFRFDGQTPYTHALLNGEVKRLDHSNTELYTYAYKFKEYDNIYIADDEEKAKGVGLMIFRVMLPDFSDLVNGLVTHDFYHVHSPTVSEFDKGQYEATLGVETVIDTVTVEDKIVDIAMQNLDAEWLFYDGEES